MPLEEPREDDYSDLLGLNADEEKPEETGDLESPEELEADSLEGEGVDLLTKSQDYLVKVASNINRIGIILGSKYSDHSSRSNLSAISDQITAIANGLNERIIKTAAKGMDVEELFPGD